MRAVGSHTHNMPMQRNDLECSSSFWHARNLLILSTDIRSNWNSENITPVLVVFWCSDCCSSSAVSRSLILMLISRTKHLFPFSNGTSWFPFSSTDFDKLFLRRPFYAWLMSKWLFHECNSRSYFECVLGSGSNICRCYLEGMYGELFDRINFSEDWPRAQNVICLVEDIAIYITNSDM